MKKILIALFSIMIVLPLITVDVGATEKTKKELTVKNTSVGIELKWENAEGTKNYKIFRKTSNKTWKLLKTISAGKSRKFVDKNVEGATVYVYKIVSPKAVYTERKIKRLSKPQLKKIVVKATEKSRKAVLKWNKVKGAKGYRVYRKVGTSKFKLIKTIKKPSTLIYSSKIDCCKKYKYYVTAYSGNSTSANSSVKAKSVSHKYGKSKFIKASCNARAHYRKICKYCKYKKSYGYTGSYEKCPAHSWGDWKTVSTSGWGKRIRKCKVCGVKAETYLDTGDVIVNAALPYVGCKFTLYGNCTDNGAFEGIDCSHFVDRALRDAGILSDTDEYRHSYDFLENCEPGVDILFENARKGDVLVFKHHMAIYMGEGKLIHSSGSQSFPIGGVRISNYGKSLSDIKAFYKKRDNELQKVIRFTSTDSTDDKLIQE